MQQIIIEAILDEIPHHNSAVKILNSRLGREIFKIRIAKAGPDLATVWITCSDVSMQHWFYHLGYEYAKLKLHQHDNQNGGAKNNEAAKDKGNISRAGRAGR